MAIHAYVGKPGHGKSYGVVERVVIPSLKQGRHVVTNIPLNADELLADFGGTIHQLPEDWFELPDLSDHVPPGCVLILDELWRRWPNGQKAIQANECDKSLLAEHRHLVDAKNNSMRIIMVTQDLSQIASWARTLIETTFRVVKLSKKLYRVDVYQGVVTGDKPPASKRIRQFPGKFDKTIQGYYQSATKSATGEVGDESVADKSASFFRSYGLWGLVFVVVVGLIGGLTAARSVFASKPPSAIGQQHGQKPEKDKSSNSKPDKKAFVPPPVVYSQTWRLSGFVHPSKPSQTARVDLSVAILVDRAGNTRKVSFSSCRYFSDLKQAYCEVDGERVTSWSSQSTSFSLPPVIQGFGGGAAQRSVSSPSG